MTGPHWLAAALAAITGSVHLYLYWNEGFLPFLFAGLVFYAAIVALTLNVYRRALYALGVPFVAGQIVLWYLQGMQYADGIVSLGVADKIVQVALIGLLIYLFVNER